MGRDDPADGSPLPAPYRSPWRLLAQDLRAAAADLRLRARAGWRRNAEGSLWRPGWWPRDLAPLFWPVLLALALAAVSAAGIVLTRRLPHPPAPLEFSAVTAESESEVEVASPPESQSELASPSAVPPAQPSTAAAPAPEPAAAEPPVPSPPAAPPDPLAALWEHPDARGMVQQVQRVPAAGLVVLQLTPAFAALPAPERQRRAEGWLHQLNALGYEHLELRDQRAGLLGRDALVGAGMILFSTPPPA